MSAFMLSRESFQRIANTLAWPLPSSMSWENPACFGDILRNLHGVQVDTSDHIATVVRDWYHANRLAVGSRYSERQPYSGRTFKPKHDGPSLTPAEMVKMLKCLGYQCAESIPESCRIEHERVCSQIDHAACVMACAIVESSPEYAAAAWG